MLNVCRKKWIISSTNLLGLLRQQWLLLTCDLVNTPAISLYGKCLLFLFTGPRNIQISLIYIPKVILHAACSISRSATCDLVGINSECFHLTLTACLCAFLMKRICWNKWWHKLILMLFFEAEKRHDFVRHSDNPQLRPGNWARAKQSRSFFLYSFSSTFKSKIKFLELDIQTLRRKGTLQCPVAIIQTS